ncbi:hypothetical protein D3C86_1777950 [compost metagenome]
MNVKLTHDHSFMRKNSFHTDVHNSGNLLCSVTPVIMRCDIYLLWRKRFMFAVMTLPVMRQD